MFATELEKRLPDLRGYTRMLCGDPELADDIVQNACLKAWHARRSFDPDKGSMKAWLFTIARNEFLQYLRKQKRVECFAPSDLENWLTQDCQMATRAACSDAIRQLFTLNAEQRDVFILVVVIGYSYEEAAKICNCSVGTIKSRISRAREKLLTVTQSAETEPAPHGKVPPHVHGLHDLMDYAEHLVRPAA